MKNQSPLFLFLNMLSSIKLFDSSSISTVSSWTKTQILIPEECRQASYETLWHVGRMLLTSACEIIWKLYLQNLAPVMLRTPTSVYLETSFPDNFVGSVRNLQDSCSLLNAHNVKMPLAVFHVDRALNLERHFGPYLLGLGTLVLVLTIGSSYFASNECTHHFVRHAQKMTWMLHL